MRAHLLASTLALALVAPAAGAQANEDDPLSRPIRAQVGGHVYYAKPVGDFAERIDQGWGGALHGTLLLGEQGVLGLRFDGGFMSYGRETIRDCITPSCLVLGEITTSNNMAFAAVGPQLMIPAGPIRPYVAGQAGWTFIWTESSIEGTNNDDQPFASSTNIDDNAFSYGGVAGLLIPFNQNARNPVSLDFGVRYLRTGEVEYLREGDIIINPGGPPTYLVQRSRADMVTYFVGISVGVR